MLKMNRNITYLKIRFCFTVSLKETIDGWSLESFWIDFFFFKNVSLRGILHSNESVPYGVHLLRGECSILQEKVPQSSLTSP